MAVVVEALVRFQGGFVGCSHVIRPTNWGIVKLKRRNRQPQLKEELMRQPTAKPGIP